MRRLLTSVGFCCVAVFTTGTAEGAKFAGAESLRAAIVDLSTTFGGRYPQAGELLARLDRVKSQDQLDALRREAMVANPLVRGQPILFVVRNVYHGIHGNMGSMFQVGEINEKQFRGGGAMKTIDFARGGRVTTLLNLAHGVARDPDLDDPGRVRLRRMAA